MCSLLSCPLLHLRAGIPGKRLTQICPISASVNGCVVCSVTGREGAGKLTSMIHNRCSTPTDSRYSVVLGWFVVGNMYISRCVCVCMKCYPSCSHMCVLLRPCCVLLWILSLMRLPLWRGQCPSDITCLCLIDFVRVRFRRIVFVFEFRGNTEKRMPV